jgi:hypothetical protein
LSARPVEIVDDELIVLIDPATFAAGGAKELLAIGADYAGVRHAIYPTAYRTLCSTPDDQLAEVSGEDEPPDCLVCAASARAFDKIDRSAPSAWFRNGTAAAA